MNEGFFLSCIAGCTLVSSIFIGMIYFRVKDLAERDGIRLEQRIVIEKVNENGRESEVLQERNRRVYRRD